MNKKHALKLFQLKSIGNRQQRAYINFSKLVFISTNRLYISRQIKLRFETRFELNIKKSNNNSQAPTLQYYTHLSPLSYFINLIDLLALKFQKNICISPALISSKKKKNKVVQQRDNKNKEFSKKSVQIYRKKSNKKSKAAKSSKPAAIQALTSNKSSSYSRTHQLASQRNIFSARLAHTPNLQSHQKNENGSTKKPLKNSTLNIIIHSKKLQIAYTYTALPNQNIT